MSEIQQASVLAIDKNRISLLKNILQNNKAYFETVNGVLPVSNGVLYGEGARFFNIVCFLAYLKTISTL